MSYKSEDVIDFVLHIVTVLHEDFVVLMFVRVWSIMCKLGRQHMRRTAGFWSVKKETPKR